MKFREKLAWFALFVTAGAVGDWTPNPNIERAYIFGGLVIGSIAAAIARKKREENARKQKEAEERERFEKSEKVRKRAVSRAEDFRSNINENKSKAYELMASPVREEAQQGIQQAKSSASSRGLLYGGFGESKQAKAGAQGLGQLQNTKVEANQRVDNIAGALDRTAAQQGLLSQQQRQSYFDKQMESQKQANSQNKGLLGFLGI